MSRITLRTPSTLTRLPRRTRTRALIGGAAAIGVTAAAVGAFILARAVAPAATYDCHANPICEYVKIERVSAAYQYDAEMQFYTGTDPRIDLYSWSETNPKSTLWHWYSSDAAREYDLKIHLKVTVRAGDSEELADFDEVLSAYRSWCFKIDEHGAYRLSECLDDEDIRTNRGMARNQSGAGTPSRLRMVATAAVPRQTKSRLS